MKSCYSCKLLKKLPEFTKDKSRRDGLNYECRSCSAEKYRKGGSRLREKKRIAGAKRRLENPARQRKYVFDSYHWDIEISRKKARERRWKSVELYRKTQRIRQNRRYKEDLNYKLRMRLSNRIYYALRKTRTVRSRKTSKLVGCSFDFLQARLKFQFKPGMTWENYGPVWHVDHIKPCAKFDLTDPEQQKICFHWTNLQPLFAAENFLKGGR